MVVTAKWANLPFKEAIEYARNKVNMPTQHWDDMLGGMHARAFTVAGASRDDMLSEFLTVIDRAIAEGKSIAEFRRTFDDMVEKYGWNHTGGRKWRQEIIFNTNVNTAYAAGTWKKIEESAEIFPYLMYCTMDDSLVRLQHRQWNKIILPVSHPWWRTHYPPNGWRCRCYVRQLTAAEARELLGQDGYTDQPEADEEYEHTNQRTGEVTKEIKGFDRGWNYNPGVAAWGSRFAEEAQEAVKGLTPLDKRDYKTWQRPERIPLAKTNVKPMAALTTESAAIQWLKDRFGENKDFTFKQGDFTHKVILNAETFGSHVATDRTPFFPFIADILTDPFEVWGSFEQALNGKIVLRYRYIKGYELGKGKALLTVFDAAKGFLTGHTFIPSNDLKYMNKQRIGHLLYGKD